MKQLLLICAGVVLVGCEAVDHHSSDYGPDSAEGRWCNVCKTSFATWDKFNVHERSFHGEPPPHDLREKWQLLFDKKGRP
ncbi:MAG: hypothetical protein QF406_08185 [Verrucomicrobiota bacterium]|jgi:hypothetical protein|nr:hypothetical protein [Verrucomicrobiota bacterium]